jgi:hypothetical protein
MVYVGGVKNGFFPFSTDTGSVIVAVGIDPGILESSIGEI